MEETRKLSDDEKCVTCGKYVPEGTHVCDDCLKKYNLKKERKVHFTNPEEDTAG